ncbi:MAG TPA: cytochrome c-type biogenesis CcmF C-terminal domain-containing protein, partial [Terriglobia bacterium]|nr:cytochrome c-type biogenesis CcmF C-terminal domain-containing protein [Terriglobia bacterium]
RFFLAEQESLSHVALHSTLAQDLYVVMAGQDPGSGKAIIHVIINPLVQWVWIGGIIVLLGTLLALVPSRIERQMADLHKGREELAEAHHVS